MNWHTHTHSAASYVCTHIDIRYTNRHKRQVQTQYSYTHTHTHTHAYTRALSTGNSHDDVNTWKHQRGSFWIGALVFIYSFCLPWDKYTCLFVTFFFLLELCYWGELHSNKPELLLHWYVCSEAVYTSCTAVDSGFRRLFGETGRSLLPKQAECSVSLLNKPSCQPHILSHTHTHTHTHRYAHFRTNMCVCSCAGASPATHTNPLTHRWLAGLLFSP